MATIVEMPKLSDTMSEGSVAHWLKKEGEKVTSGLPLLEIDTDKATMEYESPAGGVLLKILVGDGEKCPLQAPIAVIGKADENWQEALEKYNAKKGGGAAKPTADTSKSAAPSSGAPELKAEVEPTTHSAAVKASPLAKKIAQDKGIDLQAVQGTGPGGRVVQRDLLGVQTTPQTPQVDFEPGQVQRIPHTNMRKTIARRLSESVTTAPHFYLTVSINVTNIMSWRKEFLAKMPEDKKFSVNDLIIFLTARALKKHPFINSSWQDDAVLLYPSVHMSVAVALPAGLVTPVVRNADKLNLLQIAQESKRLVKIAKDGKLQPQDYSGGTFSISNLGMSGVEEFTAIINPPQAAILAVGATLPTPVVLSDGSLGTEQRMKVTLSCDHRVIDGAVGAEFLKTLKQSFENPLELYFFT